MPKHHQMAAHIYAPSSSVNAKNIAIKNETNKKTKIASALPPQFCHKLGPFVSELSFQEAQAALRQRRIIFSKETKTQQTIDVYRLLVGPFVDRVSLADALENLPLQLQQKFFVQVNSLGLSEIVFKVFAQQQAAMREKLRLSAVIQGIKVRKETLRFAVAYWLTMKQVSKETIQYISEKNWDDGDIVFFKSTCSL